MFICSMKASKIKVLLIVAVFALIGGTAIALMPSSEYAVTVNRMSCDKNLRLDGLHAVEDMVQLLEKLGYEVQPTPVEEAHVRIPTRFDAVMQKYNAIQKSQGFQLGKYKNKKVHRFTFAVTKLAQDEPLPEKGACISLILYKDHVIGGDLLLYGEKTEVRPFLIG